MNLFSVSQAQDFLPVFSAKTTGNGKVIISWRNNYKQISQISIQRSADSLRGFTTLLTVPDPRVIENGFVDAKAPDTYQFYRLFIVLDSGKYLFTKSHRPGGDAQVAATATAPDDEQVSARVQGQRVYYPNTSSKEKPEITGPKKIGPSTVPEIEKAIFIKREDTLVGKIMSGQLKKFRDSMLSKTKDTLFFASADTILIKTFIPKEVYRISSFVFTGKDGNVNITLPNALTQKFSVRFYEDDKTPLFEIKEIHEPSLIVDKTNFAHAGWFRFELYEGGKLKEKNKIFIPKDF